MNRKPELRKFLVAAELGMALVCCAVFMAVAKANQVTAEWWETASASRSFRRSQQNNKVLQAGRIASEGRTLRVSSSTRLRSRTSRRLGGLA